MDDQEKRAGVLSGGRVTRREVLKAGVIGAAGLTVLPAVIAACSTGSATPAPSGGGALTGKVTIGSNLSDAVPKKALADVITAFTTVNPGVTVTVNTVDHTTFQNQISSYLAATPEDVVTWFSGFRMRAFVDQGLFTPIDDVWAGPMGALYTDAYKTACTASDGKLYMVPFDTYAWTVYYVPSLWKTKGYTIPTTLAELKTLAAKMKTDNIVPIGLGQKDGWPAMGHFDILDLRENGYQFHVDLMAGKNKWTDPKVAQVFTVWKDLLPFYQDGAAGRLWQDAAAGLLNQTTGMMLQPQVVETFTAAGADKLAEPWDAVGRREGSRRPDRRLHAHRKVDDPPGRHGRRQGLPRVPGHGRRSDHLREGQHGRHCHGRRRRSECLQPASEEAGRGHRRRQEAHPVPRS
jgi:multiple sugar transport system substrate-binding protein